MACHRTGLRSLMSEKFDINKLILKVMSVEIYPCNITDVKQGSLCHMQHVGEIQIEKVQISQFSLCEVLDVGKVQWLN